MDIPQQLKTKVISNFTNLKQNSSLFILALAFFGSATLHATVMLAPMPTLWRQVEKESDDIIEVVVEVLNEEKPIIAEKLEIQPEITKESEMIPKESLVEAAPPIIALAPKNSQNVRQNIGIDAPASDRLKPMTSSTGDIAIPTNVVGKIIQDNARGWGFGVNKEPTGFVRGGDPEGDPKGVVDGKKDGVVDSNKDGKGTEPVGTAVNLPIPNLFTPPTPLRLECISCPKPQYRGKEGTPRVTYDIAPDGKVTNVRLRKSSGDPETDRETLEAMTKWQFNPKTIPEGGRVNVKVRVTFEESGSQFQRENEDRRRATEQQRITDRELQQREAERAKPTIPVVKAPEKIPVREPEPIIVKPEYIPPSPPVYVAPVPVYVPPVSTPPAPEPAYIPELPPPPPQ